MKIVYLTAGAAGMFCGSCMHDNTLAKAIARKGVDIELVPTYTPIRTDENDVSVDQVFFGGINIYLQQKVPFLRLIPKFFDRVLDNPWLIKRVTQDATTVNLNELGRLAVSMLKGPKGNQKKEVKRLTDWLQKSSQPDFLIFSNMLIGGCIPVLKNLLKTKLVVTLQGDDIFLDSLPEKFRSQCIEEMKKIVPHVDRFITHSQYYADYMSDFLTIPSNKISITPLGIELKDLVSETETKKHPPTIGFLARLAPEKGLSVLVDAFIKLRERKKVPNAKLKIAGWLGSSNRQFAEMQFQKLQDANLGDDFEYLGAVNRQEKIRFLKGIDVLSVPTIYKEPKGLYVLEALALGVPVIQPSHGAFPEIISDTQGGILIPPNNSDELADTLAELLLNENKRVELGKQGQQSVRSLRNSESMATSTLELLNSL